MKKALWGTLGLILMSALLAGAFAACAREGKSIAVDISYSGKQVEMSIGDSLVITLPSDASTGYSWSAWVSDETILLQSEHVYIGQVGAGGKEIWTFKALTEATCTIIMEYSRPQEEEVTPAQTFDLTVEVQ